MSLNSADGQTATLCAFVAELDFDLIPPRVVRYAKGLMIDWLGSALAGKGAHQVEIIDSSRHVAVGTFTKRRER